MDGWIGHEIAPYFDELWDRHLGVFSFPLTLITLVTLVHTVYPIVTRKEPWRDISKQYGHGRVLARS